MKFDFIQEDSRKYREYMQDDLFRCTARTVTHLETLAGGLTPAQIWNEVLNMRSVLRQLDARDRDVMLYQFHISYRYSLMRETELNYADTPRSDSDIDRSLTCLFYCLRFSLDAVWPDGVASNPNHDLIEAIDAELDHIGHPVLAELRRGISEDAIRYVRLNGPLHAVDPLSQGDDDLPGRLKRVTDYYSERMDTYLEPGHRESFYRFWEALAADAQLCGLLGEPVFIKGDAHTELGTGYNAKFLFNIYGMLYRRGYFLPSIKGETPLSVLVSGHYDSETGNNVKARYEYFKPEGVGCRPQFKGAAGPVLKRISSLIDTV